MMGGVAKTGTGLVKVSLVRECANTRGAKSINKPQPIQIASSAPDTAAGKLLRSLIV